MSERINKLEYCYSHLCQDIIRYTVTINDTYKYHAVKEKHLDTIDGPNGNLTLNQLGYIESSWKNMTISDVEKLVKINATNNRKERVKVI